VLSFKAGGPLSKPTELSIRFERCKPVVSRSEEIANALFNLYLIILLHPICLLCIGKEELLYKQRMRYVLRKDVLEKHIKVHFKDSWY
jgi:hypothetical protein